MRHRIWLLALVVLMVLACTKRPADTSPTSESASGTNPMATVTATPTPYKVTVSFEGLAGYVNSRTAKGDDVVWVMLPNADPAKQPPPYADASDPAHYARHYAMLKVFGKNVKGFDQPINLQIPIDGYDIKITSTLPAGTVNHVLDATRFYQTNPKNSVDQVIATMLKPTPADPRLAARMLIPATDLTAYEDGDFGETMPGPKKEDVCPETTAGSRGKKRVEWVEWSPTLTDDLTLTLSPLVLNDPKHPEFELILHPEAPGKNFNVEIVNQVAESIMNPDYQPAHWAAYRWFYNLSNSGTDCTLHYYPDGPGGGNRCPQKLYWE